MYLIIDYTFIMPDSQEELNEYVKANYSSAYAYRDKPYYSIENDEYSGPDDVIDDIKRIQKEFPGKDFEVHGSVKYEDSGEYCDYKYVIENGNIKLYQTPVYSIIEDISDYETAEELLEAYPWLGQNFSDDILQEWIDKNLDEVYYWSDLLSEVPPDTYYETEYD